MNDLVVCGKLSLPAIFSSGAHPPAVHLEVMKSLWSLLAPNPSPQAPLVPAPPRYSLPRTPTVPETPSSRRTSSDSAIPSSP